MKNTPMGSDQPRDRWKIEVNDRYQKVVGAVLALATGSLVLPALFLREILGVPRDRALVTYLDRYVYLSWGLLCASILLCIVFYYFSAKWVKSAWAQPTILSSNCIERLLDWSFWFSVAGFILGVLSFLWFIVSFQHAS